MLGVVHVHLNQPVAEAPENLLTPISRRMRLNPSLTVPIEDRSNYCHAVSIAKCIIHVKKNISRNRPLVVKDEAARIVLDSVSPRVARLLGDQPG